MLWWPTHLQRQGESAGQLHATAAQTPQAVGGRHNGCVGRRPRRNYAGRQKPKRPGTGRPGRLGRPARGIPFAELRRGRWRGLAGLCRHGRRVGRRNGHGASLILHVVVCQQARQGGAGCPCPRTPAKTPRNHPGNPADRPLLTPMFPARRMRARYGWCPHAALEGAQGRRKRGLPAACAYAQGHPLVHTRGAKTQGISLSQNGSLRSMVR